MHQFDKLRQPIRFSHSNIITLFLTNCTIELNKEKKNKTLQNSGYREQFNKTWNQIFPCTDYTSICVKHISTRHQMYGINLISLCTWIRINKKKNGYFDGIVFKRILIHERCMSHIALHTQFDQSNIPYYAFLTILYAELVIKAMDILSGNNHTLTDIYALTLSHIIHICICMDGVLWVRTWQPLVLCSSATHTAHSVRGEWRHRRLDCNQCNEWVRGSNTDKHKHQTEAIKRYDIMKVGGGSMNSEQLSQCYRNGIEVVLLIHRFSCLLESDIAIFCTIIKLCEIFPIILPSQSNIYIPWSQTYISL